MQGILGYMVGELMKSDPRQEGGDVTNLYKVGQNTRRLLLAAGDLVVGWLLLRQAEVAHAALDAGAASAKDQRLLRGQGRGRVLLRPDRPAEARRRARRSPRPPTTP